MKIKVVKKHWFYFSLAILVFLGFYLRVKGLSTNYSFWTDEGHVAIFARAILERGRPVLVNNYSTGSYQWLWYWLTAGSMKILGVNEFAARLPSVIFGVLTIVAIYLLAKKFFDKKVGLVSAILTTFLAIEILWSRQARPYQAIQFFYLLEFFLFLKILDAFENKRSLGWLTIGLFFSIVISSLMHWFALLPIVFFAIYLLFFRFDLIKKSGQKILAFVKRRPLVGGPLIFLGVFVIVFFLYQLNFFFAIKQFIFPAFGKVGFYNHTAYYHSFLWRQYGLITFLALLGLMISLFRNFKKNSLILVALCVSFGFINFRLRVPFSRYLYPIFPLIIILSAYCLAEIAELLAKAWPKKPSSMLKAFFLFGLTFFIIFNGYKFNFKPRPFYSLNADMQEIPEVDFKGLYNFLKEKADEVDDWVLITTWCDHATWYLGEDKPDYWLRKKEVVYGEERDFLSGALILGSAGELEAVMKKHPRGFVLLESWEPFIPEGAREFIVQSFKKELEVDRIYPIQPRYWPVEVFSWGFD